MTRFKVFFLLASVFVISICALSYELLSATISTYLLGDTIFYFSFVIGIFLSSMGIGSFLSKYMEKDILKIFIEIELGIALVGGGMPLILFYAFSQNAPYFLVLSVLTLIIGALIGMEIPIIIRILKSYFTLKDNLSHVLALDYIGALFGSILFPLFFVPVLGVMETGFFFGIVNCAVAFMTTWVFKNEISSPKKFFVQSIILAILYVVLFAYSSKIVNNIEKELYDAQILFAKNTPYQRIVVTKDRDEFRLYLNGNLQFSTRDEYRYHESLVHPALSQRKDIKNVLILGGGDGMALREVLKHKSVKNVTLVDIDKEMTDLFKNNPTLKQLNNSAFHDPRVTVINDDAFSYLKKVKKKFDCIIADFPDPTNYSINRLYTLYFYKIVFKILKKNGIFVTQATSPYFANKAYWCIFETVKKAGFDDVLAYYINIPSFGIWGFHLAKKGGNLKRKIELENGLKLRFLSSKLFSAMQIFPKDMQMNAVLHNTLNNPVLVRYYYEEWDRWE